MGSDKTTQPGCNVEKSLWKRFRQDVEDRRGRINGVLGDELEAAIEAYLEGSEGGDMTDELRRLNEDVDEIRRMIEQGGPPAADGGSNKEKNSSAGKDSRPTDENGESVGSDEGDEDQDSETAYRGEGEDRGDRSIVERRTDAAVAELLSIVTGGQFKIEELDEAIERGAGVTSRQTVREYRERVISRLSEGGGMSDLVLPALQNAPLKNKVFFTDPDDQDVALAIYLIEERGAEIDHAIEETGADESIVRERVTPDDRDDTLEKLSDESNQERAEAD